jgi:hypothetical protein
LPLPLGKGMACASFIVSVFRSLGFQLIDEASWPSGRIVDQEWGGEWVVHGLEGDPRVPHDHVAAVRNDIAQVRRFRPCDVGAAMISDNPPVQFLEAEKLANEKLAEIAAARNAELATIAAQHAS